MISLARPGSRKHLRRCVHHPCHSFSALSKSSRSRGTPLSAPSAAGVESQEPSAYDGQRNRDDKVSIFMAGIPGSGKTTQLDKRFGLQNITLCDLDREMKRHIAYNREQPHLVCTFLLSDRESSTFGAVTQAFAIRLASKTSSRKRMLGRTHAWNDVLNWHSSVATGLSLLTEPVLTRSARCKG